MNLRQNGFVLVLLTVLIGIVSDWALGGHLHLWALPAALLLLGLAYERLLVRRAQPTLQMQMRAHWLLARSTPVTLELASPMARSLTLELAPTAPEMVELDTTVRTVTVPAGAPARVALTAVSRRLGSFVWPALRARLSGPLGLAWWSAQLPVNRTVRVTPDILEDSERVAGIVSAGARSSARTGSGAQILQLRQYQPGDSLRVVDWKSTARRRSLVSRDFTEDQHLDIVIGIDVGRSSAVWCGDLDRLGWYANVAARFAQYAVAQDDRVGLLAFADQPLKALPVSPGMAAVMRIRQVLGGLQPLTVDSNPALACARIRALAAQRSLVILLTDIDAAGSTSQLVNGVRLLQPKHLPFVVGVASAALEEFARRPANSWLDPYQALAAEEYRSRRQRSIAALRSLGVPALIARPEQLEHAVFDAYQGFRQRRRI